MLTYNAPKQEWFWKLLDGVLDTSMKCVLKVNKLTLVMLS